MNTRNSSEPQGLQRRHLLRGTAGGVALAALAGPVATAVAQPRSSVAPPVSMTQLMDVSVDQQALSRDYATGIRLAFAEMKKAGASVPQLSTVEVDGTEASVRAAVQDVADDLTQVALIGTVGEQLALATLKESMRTRLSIAHVAPWMADGQFDADPSLFALFASREDQIRYVLKNLAAMQITEIGLVYPNPERAKALQQGAAAIAERLQLKARAMIVPPTQGIEAFAARLAVDAPFVLVFMGSSVELASFTRGLGKQQRLRYVVCLADVDASAFMQLSSGRAVPIIFTQVVPNPNSNKLQVGRSYRAALQHFFDEAPSPLSFAGYLAGRYALAVFGAAGPHPTRAKVLAEFQRRRPLDIEDYRIEFADKGRASSFVSQTLLNAERKFVS